MGQSNKYWTAYAQAYIPNLDWVSASWGSGNYAANKLRLINAAFEIYYLSRKSINKCDDATQRTEMLKELEDAACAGWGSGVRDLDDAFEHWLEPGKWTDEHTASYYYSLGGTHVFGHASQSLVPGGHFSGNGNSIQDGPEAGVNFLTAMDKKMKTLKGSLGGYYEAVALLARAWKEQDWKSVMDAFNKAARYGQASRPLLWFIPSEVKAAGGTVFKFGGALVKIHSFAGNYSSARRIFDDKTSIAFAALCEAAKAVPVLGAFYSAMIEGIPGLALGVKETIEGHYRTIDRMVAEATYR